MNANVTIENGNLVIRTPVLPLAPSKSGKNLVVATSSGNGPTNCTIPGPDGKPRTIILGFNAYVKP